MKYLLLILLTFSILACSEYPKKITIEHPDGFFKEVYHINKDSILHGPYIKYYQNGIIADSCEFFNGHIHGTRKLYTEEGILEIEESYVNGNFEGPYITYYSNGQIKKQQQYVNNMIQGQVNQYYPSGKIKAIIEFVDSYENGPFTEYYENGNMHWQGFYQGGDFEQDTLKEFDENGSLKRKLFCEAGVCQTIWTPEKGNIEIESFFKEN